MRLAAGTGHHRRTRTQAGVALVVLTAWFGTLLVAAPTASHASASGSTADPSFVNPAAAGTTSTPSFAFAPNDVSDPVECGWANAGSTAPTAWSGCTTPYVPSLPDQEGSYDVWIRSVHTPVDPLAPDSATVGIDLTPTPSNGISTTYVIDRTQPVVTLASSSGATWTFTADEPATITCVLSGGPTTVTGACGPGDNFPGKAVADGTYTVTATATDAAGNTGTASTTYSQDNQGPTLTLVQGPATGAGSDTTPGWQVSTDDPAAVTCSLSLDGTALPSLDGPCVGIDYPAVALSAEGTYVLTATSTDAADNTTAKVLGTYKLDTTAPVLALSTTSVNSPTPTWKVDTNDPATAISCTLTGTLAAGGTFTDGPADCTSGYTAPTLAQGTYRLAATSTDAVGNTGTATSADYVYDKTGPAAPVITVAGGPTPAYSTGSFTWTVSPGSAGDTDHISCVVTYNGGSPNTDPSTSSCSSVQVAPAATEQGTWMIVATAYDAFGNPSATATASTTYDDIAPTITVTDKTTSPRTPTWHVAVDADATATCSVAGALTATDCTNKDVSADLTGKDGAVYTLAVNAIDLAGHTTSSTVDYVLPPDAPVVTVPTQGNAAPAWTISAQAGAFLTCTLVDPNGVASTPAVPCVSGMTPTLTGDGSWQLKVVASYDNGSTRVSSAPGTASFFLDTTAPGLPTVTDARNAITNDGAIRWDVAMPAGDTPTRGAVRVDCDVYFTPVNGSRHLDRTISGCQATTWTLGLSTTAQQGVWQIEAHSVDAVGNTSSPVPSNDVTYDISAPGDPVIAGLRTPSNDAAPVLTINTDQGTALQCAWTSGGALPEWQPCQPFGTQLALPSPAADGTYTLNVQAHDTAGNASAVVTQAYVLDRTRPLAPSFSAPTSPSSSATVAWVVTPQPLASGPEVGYHAECVLLHDDGTGAFVADAAATWAPCATSYALPGENAYKLQARITDQAGNVGVVGTSTAYVYDKTPPAIPSVQGPAVSPSKSQTATWTFAPASPPADPGLKLQCLFVENGQAMGTFADCPPSPLTRTDLAANGIYALEVRSVDAAGNASDPVTSDPYVVDNSAPAAPLLTTPAATSNVRTTTWNFSSEAGSTATCQLLLNGVAPQGSNPITCATGDPWNLSYGDGSYTLQVFVTDKAGNVGPTATSSAYLLDTVAPAAPTGIAGSVTGTANTLSGRYTFTTDPGTVSCRVLYAPTGVLVPAPIGNQAYTTCTSPWAVSFDQGDGKYQLQLHVTDAAGNVGPDADSDIYTLDTTGPSAAVFTSQPSGTKNSKVVTWSWTGETPSTGLCTLTFTSLAGVTTTGAAVACDSGTYTATLDADGAYTLSVQLVDPWTNKGVVSTSGAYTLDATPPGAPAVTGPGSTSNDTTADYAIASAVEAGATAECLLYKDGAAVGGFTSCTLPRTIDLPGDGSYVLQVRLTDQYGNVGLPGSSPTFVLDTKAPPAPVVTAPTSPSSNAAPVFTVATDPSDTASATCTLSRGAVSVASGDCTAGSFTASLNGLTDGDYVLTAVARDKAGNTTPSSPASYTYDTTKPSAPVVTGPAGPSQTRNPVFGWTGEAGATAECSLQEKAGSPSPWAACSTPYAPTLPGDGTWMLSVRLTDAARNVSDAGTSGAYVFDTTPPAIPAVTAPTSPGRDLNPSWSALTEDGSTTECRISGPGQLGAWARCQLPLDTPVTADGTYTFEVRATDPAGNVSAAGSGTYVLDTTAPAAPVVTQPTGPGRSHTPQIAFTSEAGTTGSCKLTHGTTVLSDAAPCSSPTTLSLTGLPDGAYALSVRAVDAAGNVGPAGTATYVLDTTAPAAPVMTLVPGSPSSSRSPSFAFNTEAGTTASCKVTAPGGTAKDLPCSSSVTLDLSNATDGDYVLAVRATDSAGNVGAPATVTYSLDSNAPAAPLVAGPVSPGSNRAPLWKVTSSSPAECRLMRGTTVVKDWAPCGTSYAADLYAQPDGAYVLEARVVGTTAATTSRYRLDTAGPLAATIVAPPSPSTDRKPTWAISSPDATATAQCRVLLFTSVLKDWAPCGVSLAGSLFSYDLTGAGDGTYTLAVKLTDAAGNTGAVATSDYVLDNSAPAAVGIIPQASPGSDQTPTWTLVSAPDVKLECRLSSGQSVITDFAPCSGSFTADLTGLPDGTYTLTVHALSAAGTPGPDAAKGYILDTTAADKPSALAGPTGPSRDRAPMWTFTLPAGSTGQCLVKTGTKVVFDGSCSSPFALDLSTAADGQYTLTVRAVDAAGNPSSPATAGYTLKTTAPPVPTYTMLPGSPSSTTNPSWAFSLSRGTTGQCRLLQGGTPLEDWATCTSPATAMLSGKPDGVYTMQVRAIDLAGNTSSPASGGGDYTFDRSAAPIAQFADLPQTPSRDTSPTWVIAAPAAAAPADAATAALLRTAALTGTPQTECRLTTAAHVVGSWAPCSGRYTATTNGDGTYLLEVRAFDAAGERGPTSSSTYTLDTRAPGAPRFVDPLPPVVGNDADVAWSWADEGNLVECRLLRNDSPLGPFAECAPPYVASLTRLGEATYKIVARATDAAGNVGPEASASYRYDVTPPAAPTFAARPPARGTSANVGWTFAVPVDTHAVCIVSRDGTVISEGACLGAFNLDLRGQQPATWTLSVHLVDSAGNAGPATAGSYTLTTATAGGRVSSPGGPGVSDIPAASGGSGGAIPPVKVVPAKRPVGDRPILSGPGADPKPGAALVHDVPQLVKKAAKTLAEIATGLPGPTVGTDVPKAIKNVLGQTITKPQLPLALFVIVLLFLLVQNRIDRRDPKLAAAPRTAEPELTFGPVLRSGGATA
jgi:hypothetical protein